MFMKNILLPRVRFLLSGTIVALLIGTGAQAANPNFRFPVGTTLSPIYSAYYDEDTSSGNKNYQCTSNTSYNGHQGTDIRANIGTPVFAAADGSLYYNYNNCTTSNSSGCGGGYGNHVRIDHERAADGTGWVSIYAHMKQNTAAATQSVLCGAKIGETGSSGNSTGPHLHFEVRKYGYPNDDPFRGNCSNTTGFWVTQQSNPPGMRCQNPAF